MLTAQEAQDLFASCATLTAEGTSVVFISHKLNEVLDVADRVTVLRRGEKIDTVPTEGATERSLARLMVGRDVLLRVEKPTAHAGRAGAGGPRPRGPRRPRPARRARRLLRGARGRDRRARRRRRQRPERADRGDHGAAPARRRHRARRRARTSPAYSTRETLAAGVGHIAEDRHRRGLVLEFDLAREHLPARVPQPGDVALRLALAEADDRRAPAAC